MTKNIRHVGIVSCNIKKDLKLYKLLGFKIIRKRTLRGRFIKKILDIPKLTFYKLALPKSKVLLEIYSSKKLHYLCPLYNHFALTVKNIEKIYNLIKDKINTLSETITDEEKRHKVMFIQDYSGNLIELVEEL